MSEAKLGEFDDLVDMTERPLRPVIRRLREIIIEIDADACEVVRLGDRAATYGLGPKKMSEGYVYVLPQTGALLSFLLRFPIPISAPAIAPLTHISSS